MKQTSTALAKLPSLSSSWQFSPLSFGDNQIALDLYTGRGLFFSMLTPSDFSDIIIEQRKLYKIFCMKAPITGAFLFIPIYEVWCFGFLGGIMFRQ